MRHLLIPLFIIMSLLCPHVWRKFTIWRWRRAFAIDKAESVFKSLYLNVNGFALSREARREQDAIDYIYGEIEFTSFIALLTLVKPNQNTLFYDLGSGTGKAVLACAMVFKMQKCVGVELFKPLHDIACQQSFALHAFPNYVPTTLHIQFIHDNFLNISLHGATLIYINATGFIGETWTMISNRLEQTASCVTVISTSKPLKSNAFIVSKVTAVQMSWGVVKAYIHQRTKCPII